MDWFDPRSWFVSGDSLNETVEDVSLVESAMAEVADEDDGWQKLTGGGGRNLNPAKAAHLQKVAHYLWQSNITANRMIEMPVAYLLAEGVSFNNQDEDYQRVLTRFWRHPINKMELKLERKVRELSIFGQQFWPAFVDTDGAVQLGYLDPVDVATVVFDPSNPEQAIGIITKRISNRDPKRFRVIINGPEGLFTQRTQDIRKTFSDGDIFFFTINELSSKGLGQSDLASSADWIDAEDELRWSEFDRQREMRSFVWHEKHEGKDQSEIDKLAKKAVPPSPGTRIITNDKVDIEAKSPSLQSGEGNKALEGVLKYILSANNIPQHWLNMSGDVNRANGESMAEPTFKVLTMRQRRWNLILTEVLTYVLRQYVIAMGMGEPDQEDDPDVFATKVEFGEMTAKDMSRFTSALTQAVGAAAIMVAEGFVSKTLAARLLHKIATQMGVEYDVEDELEKAAEAESEKRKEEAKERAYSEPADVELDSDDVE